MSWDKAGRWQAKLWKVARKPGAAVGIRGIRDQRIASAVETVRLLHSRTHDGTVEQLRGASAEMSGEDPDAVMHLARRLEVKFCWQGFGAEGVYEGIFNPVWQQAEARKETSRFIYRQFGNAPSRGIGDAELGRGLQKYLRQRLPETWYRRW